MATSKEAAHVTAREPQGSMEAQECAAAGERSLSGMRLWNDGGNTPKLEVKTRTVRAQRQGEPCAHPPREDTVLAAGVGLHGPRSQARPGMAVNLLFFHVICSQMYYGAGRCFPAAQVLPRNKRLCVLSRWPQGRRGPSPEEVGKGKQTLL